MLSATSTASTASTATDSIISPRESSSESDTSSATRRPRRGAGQLPAAAHTSRRSTADGPEPALLCAELPHPRTERLAPALPTSLVAEASRKTAGAALATASVPSLTKTCRARAFGGRCLRDLFRSTPASPPKAARHLQRRARRGAHRTLRKISSTKFPAAMPTMDHTVRRYRPPEGVQGHPDAFARQLRIATTASRTP